MKIIKLSTTPVQWEAEFSIAKWERGVVSEITGKWINQKYHVGIEHSRNLATYEEWGMEGTIEEWDIAVMALYKQVLTYIENKQ